MLRNSLLSGVAVFVLALIACKGSTEPDATSTSSSSGGEPASSGGSSNGSNGNGSTSTTSSGSSGNPPPSNDVVISDESVDVDGTPRAYKLVAPKDYDEARAYPLIVAMHGDGQDAGGFIGFSGLTNVAGTEAVMAFTDQSLDLTTYYDNNKDQKMVPAIIAAVKGKRNIDAGKIWGFGYSKGAFQIGELLCSGKDIFTAVAVHQGGAPQDKDGDGNGDCWNPVKVPMFVLGGGNDKDIGSEYYAQFFAGIHGCDNPFGARTKASPDICEKFNGCDAGKPLLFCEAPGVPHYPIYEKSAELSVAWFKTL
ncbi:MAG: hypothetical protein KIT84_18065 [Labilithrix sp.]|nr:hypothetical protein [Labilithrix sp.]MCW5812939.1 hypothetical protein [Labilithrix sp.]